jgi:hypothetical protein
MVANDAVPALLRPKPDLAQHASQPTDVHAPFMGTSGPTARGSYLITAPSVGFTQRENTLLGGNGLLGVI